MLAAGEAHENENTRPTSSSIMVECLFWELPQSFFFHNPAEQHHSCIWISTLIGSRTSALTWLEHTLPRICKAAHSINDSCATYASGRLG